MIHYFGKNLATTRTIVVITAMAALATARAEMAAYVELRSINSSSPTSVGYFNLNQTTGESDEIQVSGELFGLQPGNYSFIVYPDGNPRPCLLTPSEYSVRGDRLIAYEYLSSLNFVAGNLKVNKTVDYDNLGLDSLDRIIGHATVLKSTDHDRIVACGLLLSNETLTTTTVAPSEAPSTKITTLISTITSRTTKPSSTNASTTSSPTTSKITS